MTRSRVLTALILAAASLLLAACDAATDETASDAAPADSAVAVIIAGGVVTDAEAAAAARTQFGAAGLIPRNFPSSEAADWVALYEGLDESGPLLGVYGGWFDDIATQGEIPEVFQAGAAAARQYNFSAVVGLGTFTEDVRTGKVDPTIDWADQEAVKRYTRTAVAIAREQQPPFIVIGAEVNRLWEQFPAAFNAFATAWPELYAAVNEASPETEVGTGFQFEFLRGGGFLSGETHEPRWELIDRFNGSIDFIAISSYPYFDYGAPSDLPDDYYAELAARADLPIAFTELGWPSRPLSTAPDSEYGGSADEQIAFALRFAQLIGGLDVRFALWSFQHDLGDVGGPAFESVALRLNDGTPKPVLDIWSGFTAR